MARRTLFTDPFTGTNADLGADWDRYSGVNGLQRVSDQAQAETVAAAVDGLESHSGTLPNDQWAEAVLVSLGVDPANDYNAMGVGCRWAAPNTVSGYLFLIDVDNTPRYRVSLQKYTTGTISTITTFVTITLVGSDVFRLEVIGTALTGYQNGSSIITGTDSAFASGRAAITLYPTNTLANAVADSFASGEFVTGGGPLIGPNRLLGD